MVCREASSGVPWDFVTAIHWTSFSNIFLSVFRNIFLWTSKDQPKKINISTGFMNAWKCVLNWTRFLMHLNLHTETPRQLLIRACYCNVCTLHRQRESNLRLIKILSKQKANTGRLGLVLIYLFTAICSVRVVLLFILGHYYASWL